MHVQLKIIDSLDLDSSDLSTIYINSCFTIGKGNKIINL